MSKRMWGPAPDVREVEAHHKRCGFTGNYSPWLMRKDKEVKMVVHLVVYDSGTPRASLMAQVPTLLKYKDFVCFSSVQRPIGELPDCEWCALSHDGTPMPRIDAAAPSADDICDDFAARMRGSYPDCFVGYDDVLHFYTGTPGMGRPIPESYMGYQVQVHLGVWPMPATKGGGR